MSRVPEQVRPRTPQDDLDFRARDEARVAQVPGQSDREPVREPLLRDNVVSLAPGTHQGMRVTIAGTRVVGQGDCTITRLAAVDGGPIILEGLRFLSRPQDGDRNNKSSLVTVSATSRVVFRSCEFRKADEDGGNFVAIAAGGLVNFIGCLFQGGASATNVISNAGAAGNVQNYLGANLTGVAHLNVTTVGEIT